MRVELRQTKSGPKWAVITTNVFTGVESARIFSSEAKAREHVANDQARRELEKKMVERKKETAIGKNVTIKKLLKTYFEQVLKNPVTIKQAGYHAAQIVEIFGNKRAANLTAVDARSFMEMQIERGCSQMTVNRRVGILRTALSWAVNIGVLPSNPLSEINLPRATPKSIQPPTPDELKKMLHVAPKHIFRTILIGLYTGARVGPSELFKLQWQHVDLWNRIINLPCAEKNRHINTRVIPINDLLMGYLPAWKSEDERDEIPWVVHYGKKPIRTLGKSWKVTMEKAGITRSFRPYDLRHAYATYALAHGADIKTVAEIMGHADASMILKTYQHVQPEMKRKAVEVIPAIV